MSEKKPPIATTGSIALLVGYIFAGLIALVVMLLLLDRNSPIIKTLIIYLFPSGTYGGQTIVFVNPNSPAIIFAYYIIPAGLIIATIFYTINSIRQFQRLPLSSFILAGITAGYIIVVDDIGIERRANSQLEFAPKTLIKAGNTTDLVRLIKDDAAHQHKLKHPRHYRDYAINHGKPEIARALVEAGLTN